MKKALVFSKIFLVILVTFSAWPAYSSIPQLKELHRLSTSFFHQQQTISVAEDVVKSSPNIQLIWEGDELDITNAYLAIDFFVSIAQPHIIKQVFGSVRANAP